MIPLPVPHPAHIAITIHNRDSDDPIPLESEICQSILRGIEESHGSPDETGKYWKLKNAKLLISQKGIGKYKAGEDAFETASSSSDTAETPNTAVDESNRNSSEGVYQWTLSNWGQRKRNNSGSVRVDLASPEDVTLDSDRVVFSTYGTTVWLINLRFLYYFRDWFKRFLCIYFPKFNLIHF